VTPAQFRAVLDTTAAAAYARRSVDLGEVLAEITAEDARFSVPALCLVEAAAGATPDQVELLRVLAKHPCCTVLPLASSDWQQVASAAQLLGTLGRAAAALPVASGLALYVVTHEPDAYAGIETIAI